MELITIQKQSKWFFTPLDLAQLLQIKPTSAQRLCSRYAKAGYFLKLKNGFYLLTSNLENLNQEEWFQLASYLQTPSYVSFTSALAFYGCTTQVLRGWVESAAVVRTAAFERAPLTFHYFKLQRDLFFDYEKQGNFFIATPEKALLDALYLQSMGRYRLDEYALSWNKFSLPKLKKLAKKFPKKTQKLLTRLLKNAAS